MTANEIKAYYANLLIMQYLKKPKAYATVEAQVYPALIPTEDGTTTLPLKAQDAFNIETAIGIQLDVLGKYVGANRSSHYKGNQIELNDSEFRSLIKFAIIFNNTTYSSLFYIKQLIFAYFGTDFVVFDNQNMQMSYYFDSTIGSVNLAESIIAQNLLPKPMGVQLASVIYAPNTSHFFGMRNYLIAAQNIYGFNTYNSYNMDTPWLSYSYAI